MISKNHKSRGVNIEIYWNQKMQSFPCFETWLQNLTSPIVQSKALDGKTNLLLAPLTKFSSMTEHPTSKNRLSKFSQHRSLWKMKTLLRKKKRSLMNSNQFERQQANSVDNFQSIKIHQWEKLLKQHQTWGHQNHLSQSDFCLRKGCRRTNSQNLKLHFMIGNSKINDNVEKKAETEFLNSHCANTLNVPLYALHCLLTLSVRNRKLSRAERATVANQTVTNSQRKKLKGSKGTGTSKRGKSNHKSHKAKKQRQKKKKFHIDVKKRDKKKFISEIRSLSIFKIDRSNWQRS